MAAFFKKNTLEQARFALTAEGFTHAGLNYRFADVVETVVLRSVLETKVLLVGSDYDHSISVIFGMRSGERVQLTEQPTWFGSSKRDKVEAIQEIYDVVSKKSFEFRADKYVLQLNEKGYFDYSGWRFFPEEHKIVNLESQRAYSTSTAQLMKSYGFIAVASETDGAAEKLRQRIKGRAGIGTLQDTDVFFWLLEQYFGLRWK